jgi:putative oxidoreductase
MTLVVGPMISLETHLSPWTPRLLSVLRIMTGLVLLQFGTAKTFGFPDVEMFASVTPTSLYGIAGLFELVFGALLVIGLFSRLAAFILSGEMAAAYFIDHIKYSLIPIENDGSLPVILCFVCLYLAAAGGGPWSADAARGKA